MAAKPKPTELEKKAPAVSPDFRSAPLIEHLRRLDKALPPDQRTEAEKQHLQKSLFELHK